MDRIGGSDRVWELPIESLAEIQVEVEMQTGTMKKRNQLDNFEAEKHRWKFSRCG